MALIEAIENGRVSYVDDLLDSGLDPNEVNEYGYSALMLAAQKGMPSAVKRLILKGANPNALDSFGNTALMVFIDTIKYDINTLNINSNENSVMAPNNTIFKTLLKTTDLNIINNSGYNALLIAIDRNKWNIAYNLLNVYNKTDSLDDQQRVNAISLLINSYSSIKRNKYVDVPSEISKILINGFSDELLNVPGKGINTPDSNDFNLLTLAIAYQTYFIAELLIKKGIIISDEAVDLLEEVIEEGSYNNNNNNNSNNNNNNKNKNNKNNKSTKSNSLEKQLLSLMLRIKELQNTYSKNNNNINSSIALYKAVAIDNIELVSSLIKDGVNPNEQNNLGNTPLYIACYRGNKEIVDLLLGADKIDVNKPNNSGKTPLMIAVLKKHLNIITKLLTLKDIKINEQDNEGFTALHYAAMSGNPEIIKILINKGADKFITNKDGSVAFKYARNFETKRLLALPISDFSSVNHVLYNIGAISNSNVSGISKKTIINKNNSDSLKKQIYKYIDRKDLCDGVNPEYVKTALNKCDSFIILLNDDNLILGICLIDIKIINEKEVLYIDVICTNLQYIGVGRYLINLVKTMSKFKDIVLCSVKSAVEFYNRMEFVKNESIKECGTVLKPMRYTIKGGKTDRESKRIRGGKKRVIKTRRRRV